MKMVKLGFCLFFMVVSLLSVGIFGVAQAQEEPVTDNVTPPQDEEPVPELIAAPEEEEEEEFQIEEKITIRPSFPTVDSIAGGDFEFTMDLSYVGNVETRIFDLRVTAPKGWEVYMTPRYEKERKISSVNLKSAYGGSETIRLVASAPFYPLPEPGDYKITVEAVSETVSESVELTARITAKYILLLVPTLERYDTEAEAGKDNYFSVEVGSLSTADIENIKFSSTKPEDWTIDFNPEKVDLLEAFGSQTIDINIKPPHDTIAGDYYVTIRASGKQTSTDELQLRVTVKTAPTWQWVGVGIIVIVVVGVIVVFMRFSRR